MDEQISESVWYSNIIYIEYRNQWFENGVRHIRDFLYPELKVISRQDFIAKCRVKCDFLMFERIRFRIQNYLMN